MIELKTPQEIDKMAVTGRFVGETLAELAELARPGVNLMDLEHRARRRVKEPARYRATGTTRRRSAAARSATSSACR